MAPRAALLTVIALLVAGCAQGDPPAAPKVVEEAAPPPPQSTLLRVLVVNDEFLPVWGATVRVVGLGLNATTNDVGDAFFHVPKAGRYSVHVHHVRYYPNISKIEIAGEPDAVHRVKLRDAPPHGHFREYRFYPGTCYPVVFASNLTGNGECPDGPSGRSHARFILSKGLVEAYFEVEWEQQPAAAPTMRLEARWPGLRFGDGSDVQRSEGGSPVKLHVPPQLLTEAHGVNGQVAEVRTGLSWGQPVSANVYQQFEIVGIFDYFTPAPDVDPEI
ncbi:MAG: hypothetical protein HYT80_06335 [Euryarchaeota archaeon]|nr:hypothetical protein [Euryarchaeota archaeon]